MNSYLCESLYIVSKYKNLNLIVELIYFENK